MTVLGDPIQTGKTSTVMTKLQIEAKIQTGKWLNYRQQTKFKQI